MGPAVFCQIPAQLFNSPHSLVLTDTTRFCKAPSWITTFYIYIYFISIISDAIIVIKILLEAFVHIYIWIDTSKIVAIMKTV